MTTTEGFFNRLKESRAKAGQPDTEEYMDT